MTEIWADVWKMGDKVDSYGRFKEKGERGKGDERDIIGREQWILEGVNI